MSNIVQGENYRFTIITDKLIRMEYSKDNHFEDRKTQFAQNRDFGEVNYQTFDNRNGQLLEIETDYLHLYYAGGEFDASNLFIDVKYQYTLHDAKWYYGEPVHNLGGTAKTLDLTDGRMPLQDGIMSDWGFSFIDDVDSFVIDINNDFVLRHQQEADGYFFAYGRDYKTALQDFYHLSGKTPILPRYALSNWWSRYYKYSQQEYIELMDKFEDNHIPIAVSVIDMDWHRYDDFPKRFGSGWTGYSWNKKLFPNPQQFLKALKSRGKKITLNLHPAGGIRAFEDAYPAVAKRLNLDTTKEEPAVFDFDNSQFRESYFKDVHNPMEDEGVDFWWIDWQQGTSRAKNKVEPLWSLNHYHYLNHANRHDGDGIILSRYAGPGSHRYPIGFSGDTFITWSALKFQPEFTSTASNIGYTWWSHDIGGHMKGAYDPVLSLRWLQLGVFSPINRLHSSDNPFSGKEPWRYPLNVQTYMTEFLQLRAKLLPYLDSANILTHTEGRPLVEPLYYEHPNNEEAYTFKNQYYFGSELMVAPITDPQDADTQLGFVDVWLPEGEWMDIFTEMVYQGNSHADEEKLLPSTIMEGQFINGEAQVRVGRPINQMPVFAKLGAIVPMTPDYMANPETLPETIDVHVYGNKKNSYTLFEHQGQKIASTVLNITNGELTTTKKDPEGILPSKRSYNLIKHGFHTESQKDRALNDLVNKLQFAQISYEIKREVLKKAEKAVENPIKMAEFAQTLQNKSLQAMILEFVYLLQ
ncbi:TIM-barrel domain-containing protein [Leuconostoc kimchii]|uniref:Alpha-xylosidase n=1 Tax=Leuconostoc kimchii TaxID=136609 RepID=A0ABX5SQD1_9LACO|nr:TIM-barrel domain-containing protein [Leuconostoc kimchii]QBR48336.1 alpha-xylosidase [Leuconostoc kimchii]